MSIKIQTHLESFNKIYREGDTMTGTVEVSSNEDSKFEHITAIVTGQYTIKNAKVNPPQTSIIKFYTKKVKIAENGKITAGKAGSFNLKIGLTGSEENPLYESYQGVIVLISVRLVFSFYFIYTIIS
jgi:hypothetical protein